MQVYGVPSMTEKQLCPATKVIRPRSSTTPFPTQLLIHFFLWEECRTMAVRFTKENLNGTERLPAAMEQLHKSILETTTRSMARHNTSTSIVPMIAEKVL